MLTLHAAFPSLCYRPSHDSQPECLRRHWRCPTSASWPPPFRSEPKGIHNDLSFSPHSPVELVHPAISDEWGPQRREVVARDDDGHAVHHIRLAPVLANAHSRRIVAEIHQRAHHHLVVDCALRMSWCPQEEGEEREELGKSYFFNALIQHGSLLAQQLKRFLSGDIS